MDPKKVEIELKGDSKEQNNGFYGSTPINEHTSDPGFDEERIPGMFKETTAWAVYNNEARKVDNESIRDWTASLNFLLVFVSRFHRIHNAISNPN